MKTLIIAEKPSVARDLASALGKVPKKGDWFENDNYVISSAIGHLVELFMPEDIKKEYRFWRLKELPIIPKSFQLKPIEKTKNKFRELKKMCSRKDVENIVNACDAGREGELIFTYIYEAAKCKKPVQRLWLSSMTPQAIRDAFANLKTAEEMIPLQAAARCRSEADWLVGINGTRAITKRMYGSKSAGRQVATVGRVQTPTLTIIMDREIEIREFKPRDYFRIIGQFSLHDGEYEGLYQRPDYKKSNDSHDKPDRLWDEASARNVVEDLQDNPMAKVTDSRKRTRQLPPLLYDLTSLQREANNRYGMSARKTLEIAQKLYERHKLVTYPRTDSRALPEDYVAPCIQTLKNLGDSFSHANTAIENKWVRPNKRIFNNKQVSDHFAIIPTGQKPGKLSGEEYKIYDMITRRFIAAFFPAAEYDVTTRISTIKIHTFKTEGRVLAKAGWLVVYERGKNGKDTLPAITDADGKPPQSRLNSIQLKKDATKPPPRYSEATLLSAMEGAGKLVDDEELAEAMKEKGLGTPATRAQIIEHLFTLKYLERQQKEIVPTTKAENLVNFLRAVKVDALTSPSMTGDWEFRLHQIERGKLTRKEFMTGIVNETKDLVTKTVNFTESLEDAKPSSIISPTDGKPMLEALRAYKSQDGELTVYKSIGNRKMEEAELQTLVNDKRLGPLEGFRSKAGRPYKATIKLNDKNRIEFEFENGNGNGQNGNGSNGDENGFRHSDLSKYEVKGTCPKDKGKVYGLENLFACEHSLNGETSCDFRISRKMLSKEIPEDQLKKLLEEGKTDLIEGFISKRTRKPFSAFLVLDKRGKLSFSFPPRPPRKKAASKKTKK